MSVPDSPTRLKLRVQPGAKRNAIIGPHGDALKVSVQAPPDGGRANEAVVELLAGHFGLKRNQVEILTGHASRDKVVALYGITPETIDGLIPKK